MEMRKKGRAKLTHHNAGQHNSSGHRHTVDKDHADKFEKKSPKEEGYTSRHSWTRGKTAHQIRLTHHCRVAETTRRYSIVVTKEVKKTTN